MKSVMSSSSSMDARHCLCFHHYCLTLDFSGSVLINIPHCAVSHVKTGLPLTNHIFIFLLGKYHSHWHRKY